MDETALDVLTRAATLVRETDAAKQLSGEDKATVHPVDFSSNIHAVELNYPQRLPTSPSPPLRLKRRQEHANSTSKRCLTEAQQQHLRRVGDSKENCDYLSEADDDQLSDEDTGKLVVDDNADEEEENVIVRSEVGVAKSPQTSRHSHLRLPDGEDSEEEKGRERIDRKTVQRVDEESKMDDDEEGENSQQVAVEEEQDGPLDMTTNNRSRNRNNGNSNPPRWSPSSSSNSPPAVNMPSIFYPHPPRYNPYQVSSQPPPPPPPPYHSLSQHHVSSQLHSLSPPPYLPPSYASPPHHFPDTFNAATNGHRSSSHNSRPAHSLQQQRRPSVITCTSNPGGKSSPPPLPPPSHHSHHSSPSSASSHHHRSSSKFHRSGAESLPIPNGSLGPISKRALSDPSASRSHISASGQNGGHVKSRRSSDHQRQGHRREIISGGMCDPVIDEHFRRSLGKDYPEYLNSSNSNSSSSSSKTTQKSPPLAGSTNSGSTSSSSTASISITGMSVDDHFAKALGETWLRLQNKGISSSPVSSNMNNAGSSPASPANSVGSGCISNSMSPKSVSPTPSQQRQSLSLVST